jgi:hypothetical protein
MPHMKMGQTNFNLQLICKPMKMGQKNFSLQLICKPILQAKWSNKQKTKVLCIKIHFVHFYPSIIFKNEMCPNTE